MEFFKCFVAGETYETGVMKIEVEVANAEEVQQPTKAHDTGFNFDDARLMSGAWRNEPNPDMFKTIIALMVGLTLHVKHDVEEMGIGFIGLGFQPKWERKDIPIMPKVHGAFTGYTGITVQFSILTGTWQL
ncbi:phospholipid-transporting ATPase 3-like protein [Tanacetum coccineum]